MFSRIIKISFFCVAAGLFFFACRKPQTPDPQNTEWFSGGKQTVFVTGNGAFSQVFPTISGNRLIQHERGDKLFESVFNSDPSKPFFGLGPIFNNVSCVSCHIGDGRGKAPNPGEKLNSLLIRISIDGTDPHGGPNPVPLFGGQLQQRSIVGAKPEAEVNITYAEQVYYFPDGEQYSLRTPQISFTDAYKALPGNVMMSSRIASPVFGLGLLEAIPEETLTLWEDPNDADGDGISGRKNKVWSVLENRLVTGRFGWKAGQPSVLQQSAGAANEDMGVTSFIYPVESSYGQDQYAISHRKKEMTDSQIWAIAFYIRTLAVPARRNADDIDVQRGKNLFKNIGCNSCHKADYFTGYNMAEPEFNYQRIFPYTDLLLHDMGAGLADNRPEFLANGFEWRTPPLWGIGLSRIVNGHNNFLHDGRARNFTEAIMWHGGEAQNSRNKYAQLSKAERTQLLKFLESL